LGNVQINGKKGIKPQDSNQKSKKKEEKQQKHGINIINNLRSSGNLARTLGPCLAQNVKMGNRIIPNNFWDSSVI
jgi:hypothetical protein